VSGRVEQINIGPHKELPKPVDRVEAHAGKGLLGNHHYYDSAEPGRALTLISAEGLAAAAADGVAISAAESRRNVLTSGIDLNELVGKRFKVGDVECLGVELCHPCKSLERMTKPGVIKALAHRGGLNADILSDGEIAVGDAVVASD
jgi:MOSC domain-containing protein YiiM